jgi:hypothetical protein
MKGIKWCLDMALKIPGFFTIRGPRGMSEDFSCVSEPRLLRRSQGFGWGRRGGQGR